MTDAATAPQKAKRDRSPAFPFIGLKTAIDRLVAFEAYFKRHPAPAKQVGLAWKMKGWTSQAQQTLAALKYYGLLEYQGSGANLAAAISDDGRTYLRAQQESVKQAVLKRLALKPKNIAKYFGIWGADRPPDPVCLDQLVLKGGFTEGSARTFLEVYDVTIAYAGLSDSDKVEDEPEGEAEGQSEIDDDPPPPPPPPPPAQGKVKIMEGERIVFTEESNPQNYVKLIASGDVDATMLEALEDYVKRQKKRLGGVPRHIITGEKPPKSFLNSGGDDTAK